MSDLAKVSESMFIKAVKDYKLKVVGSISSQGYFEVYDGDKLVGESSRGIASDDYEIEVKYLINKLKC